MPSLPVFSRQEVHDGSVTSGLTEKHKVTAAQRVSACKVSVPLRATMCNHWNKGVCLQQGAPRSYRYIYFVVCCII